LGAAVRRFNSTKAIFDPQSSARHAIGFDESNFLSQMTQKSHQLPVDTFC
jgi:hypothetical protein